MKYTYLTESGAVIRSPPSRGAWIEIISIHRARTFRTSPPSRGAWIEIGMSPLIPPPECVAPLAGGVD